MSEIKRNMFIAMAGAGSVLGSFVGGFDTALKTLIYLFVADYVFGVIGAMVFKVSKKSDDGGLSSNASLIGLVKKIMMFTLVGLVFQIDNALGTNGVLRNACIWGFISTEFMSIVENINNMGIINLPDVFTKISELIKEKGDI